VIVLQQHAGVVKLADAGLKIRPGALHQNAAARNALMLFGLAISCAVRCCTKMQQNEEDPALDPALDFAFARTPADLNHRVRDATRRALAF
jgi:hypothetical protein